MATTWKLRVATPVSNEETKLLESMKQWDDWYEYWSNSVVKWQDQIKKVSDGLTRAIEMRDMAGREYNKAAEEHARKFSNPNLIRRK